MQHSTLLQVLHAPSSPSCEGKLGDPCGLPAFSPLSPHRMESHAPSSLDPYALACYAAYTIMN